MRKIVIILLASSAIGIGLAACGAGGSGGKSVSAAPQPVAGPAPAASPAPASSVEAFEGWGIGTLVAGQHHSLPQIEKITSFQHCQNESVVRVIANYTTKALPNGAMANETWDVNGHVVGPFNVRVDQGQPFTYFYLGDEKTPLPDGTYTAKLSIDGKPVSTTPLAVNSKSCAY